MGSNSLDQAWVLFDCIARNQRLPNVLKSRLGNGAALIKETRLSQRSNGRNLNLHLREAVLPDCDERGGAIFAIVHEDNPGSTLVKTQRYCIRSTYIPSGSIDSPT